MTGTVTGRVCAPDGHTWLAGATVYAGDAANPTSQTQTDADGRFTLTGVPAGAQTVHVVKNSFTATYAVVVMPGGTTQIPETLCQVVPTTTRVAVVSGLYDNVRCILTGQTDPLASRPNNPCTIPGLGLSPASVTTVDGLHATWAPDFLGDFARMSTFDIIFFNCGVMDAVATTGANAALYTANLRQFVEAGGSIYASDWAAPLVEAAFPEFITWNSVNAPTNDVQLAKVGNGPQTVMANVVEPGMLAALRQSTIQVKFGLIGWVAMLDTAPATRVYFRGSAQSATFLGPGPTMSNIPFTVGFDVGLGRVVYTSFHQEQNLTADMQAALYLLVFEL